MSEAQKGFAVIKDVDRDTFLRFIQWAYNGYYDARQFKVDESTPSLVNEVAMDEHTTDVGLPQSESRFAPEELALEEPAPEPPPPDPKYDDWGSFDDRKKKHRKGYEVTSTGVSTGERSKRRLKKSFINRKPTIRQEAISILPPRPNRNSSEDYTEVFLSHARVYVFAEKHDIKQLEALALDELHETLKNFHLYPERTGDIIELLRYGYANTKESKETVEDLRTILTDYVAIEMDILMTDETFRDLMIEDGGALLGDFMKVVRKRIR